jgi:hypothetical protein
MAIGFIILSIYTENQRVALEDKLSNYKMLKALYERTGFTGRATGIYSNSIICMNVEDREWYQVMETCSHEYLHYKYDNHFELEEVDLGGQS